MPEVAHDGDTEGRNRDEKKEGDESEGQSNVSRKRNNDGEVEAGYENVKDFGIKYDWVDIEEVREEDDYQDDDDDDNEYGDSDGENYWINRTQKKRSEEEKEYMWISEIDRKTYLKVMTPQYLLLEVRSTLPLQVQHVRMAVTHLSKVWLWWGVGVRHRGQERMPWLCVAPTQRPILQVCSADDDDDDGDKLWDLVNHQQWKHTHVAEGVLSSVTLITDPSQVAAAAAAAAVPHRDRNINSTTEAIPLITDPYPALASTTAEVDTHVTSSLGTTARNDVPDLPHKAYLMLGVPRPFLEDASAQTICRTLITLLDDVVSGSIQEDYHPAEKSGSLERETEGVENPSLEVWVVERLQAGIEARGEGSESNVGTVNECDQDEENEHDTRGYVQRTFDSVTSRNFINRCKAERVSYVNGFATCVSAAAAAFLCGAEGGARGQRVVTRQRVCEHLDWPTATLEWHDGDPDEDLASQAPSRPPGVTITAPTTEDEVEFWEAARQVSRQRWESVAGDSKGAGLHILHGLVGEDSEDDTPLPRYPMVCLRLCDIHGDEEGPTPSVLQAGGVFGVGPHSLSPPRHFLITHTVNLHLEEGTQILSFSLHHSTLFFSPETGRSFADEIEAALKNSLRRR